MNKGIVHEVDHSELGCSALVTGTDGIKLWRNRADGRVRAGYERNRYIKR